MRYPIGIQSFGKIRREGFVYVDKTEYVYDLAQGAGYYFLSRPRRFGKSLLVSTLESYFSGDKKLFEGLKIAEMETEWEKYPIFRMDFSGDDYSSVKVLKDYFNLLLTTWEEEYGRNEAERTLSRRFKGVIRRACKKRGKGVVILIDEYDKPLLQNIAKPKLQEKLRSAVKAFFSALKDQDEYIRFGFITGVTKFSHVSLFSDLNNLEDITLTKEFEAICGVTKQELTDVFSESISDLAKANDMTAEEALAKLTKKYDGYHFSKRMTEVFNPYSLLNAFKQEEFGDYWFSSATPSFLASIMQNAEIPLNKLKDAWLSGSGLGNIEKVESNPVPMLFQAGYLTIKNYDKEDGLYELGFPNEEVYKGFFEALLPYCAWLQGDDPKNVALKLKRSILAGDITKFMLMMKSFFSGRNYLTFTKLPIE